mmetsp:Transcript_38547/g.28412  ORF Transcript_38547/g.28412 Transcript_38547/m.28412 type:complete len:84 (+) Transcript_38547:528-779(+)
MLHFSSETLEDEIKKKIGRGRAVSEVETKKGDEEKEYIKLMKGLVEMGKLVDESEKRKYLNYLELDDNMQQTCIFNYRSTLAT